MARKLQIEWHEDVERLGALYRAEKDRQNRRRLHALWLVRQGRTMREVAASIGVHYRTLQEWLCWYRQGGVAAVLARRHGGERARESRLRAAQAAALKAKADEMRCIADGVRWAQGTHQVQYSYWGMRHVFARLQLRLKVPRPRNPKASTSDQEAWKKGG